MTTYTDPFGQKRYNPHPFGKNTTCPRCGGPIPDGEHAGQFAGAVSRYDNETEVCSDCGTDEAMWQMQQPGGFGNRYRPDADMPPPDTHLGMRPRPTPEQTAAAWVRSSPRDDILTVLGTVPNIDSKHRGGHPLPEDEQ